MSHVYSNRVRQTIGLLQIVILVLVAITAYVHFSRGVAMSSGGPPRLPVGAAGRPAGGPPGGAPRGFNIMQLIPIPLGTLFLLNGIAYIVLGVALYLPALSQYQPIVRGLLIALAAVTILMYLAIVGVRTNPTGWIDKVVEVSLIVLLLIDARRPATAPANAMPNARTT